MPSTTKPPEIRVSVIGTASPLQSLRLCVEPTWDDTKINLGVQRPVLPALVRFRRAVLRCTVSGQGEHDCGNAGFRTRSSTPTTTSTSRELLRRYIDPSKNDLAIRSVTDDQGADVQLFAGKPSSSPSQVLLDDEHESMLGDVPGTDHGTLRAASCRACC